MLDTKHTLTIPERALRAAESLVRAMYDLNAADGAFCWSGDAAPFGAAEHALRRTLAQMVATDSDDPTAEAFARFVVEYIGDNGENVEYQITQVLGWTLVLTPASYEDAQEPRTIPGNPSNYRDRAPSILGGSR